MALQSTELFLIYIIPDSTIWPSASRTRLHSLENFEIFLSLLFLNLQLQTTEYRLLEAKYFLLPNEGVKSRSPCVVLKNIQKHAENKEKKQNLRKFEGP